MYFVPVLFISLIFVNKKKTIFSDESPKQDPAEFSPERTIP